MRLGTGLVLAAAMAACTPAGPGVGSKIEAQAPVAAATQAAVMHEGFMILDSHLDTPEHFHHPEFAFSNRGSFEADGTQVDIPRMKEGGLDGGFFVIYTDQGELTAEGYAAARNSAVLRQMAIREVAAKNSDEVELAFSAGDAERITATGKRVMFQSIENSYPLGLDVSLLETFYIGGVRMVGPVHFRNNQFADSSTDEEVVFDGLSPLGEDLVREANRLGMILDGSHASDSTVWDMLALSTTPLILSHSGPRAIYDHPRNLPDDLLLAVAEAGGVIQINAYSGYLELLEPSEERVGGIAEIEAEFGDDFEAMDAETQVKVRAAYAELAEHHPAPRSSFATFLDHLLYALDLVGPEHVGMGADWDGGGGVIGMEDVSYLPRVTEALLTAGYSEDDLANIWSGNMMRLMRAAEAARTSDASSPASVN